MYSTDLHYHFILDFAELCSRYSIFRISPVQVSDDSHTFFVFVRVNEPPSNNITGQLDINFAWNKLVPRAFWHD